MARNRLGKIAAVVTLAGAALLANAGISHAIVNGSPTTASAHPWQVSLEDSEGQMCGGSIVSETVVVTAAHCTEGFGAGELTVRVGVTNLADTGGQSVSVAKINNHPDYARLEVGDIAKLDLAEPLRFNSSVQPIALATAADLAGATTATVSGWGATSENGDGNNRLLTASVPLVSDAACDRALGGIDSARETCAGGTGTDSCYGDSGGPLVIRVNGTPKLAGVVSWGEECGGNTPGVYAEVPTYSDWIGVGGTSTPSTTPTPAPTPTVDEPETPIVVEVDDPNDDFDADYDYDYDYDYDFDDSDYDDSCFWVEGWEYDNEAGEWFLYEELECDDDYEDFGYDDYSYDDGYGYDDYSYDDGYGYDDYSYGDDDYDAWYWNS